MKIPEKFVLAFVPLIDDIANLISMTTSRNIYKENTRLILDFIMLVAICWNVAEVAVEKDNVIAGLLKGSVMLLFGFVLLPSLLDDVIKLGKNKTQSVLIGILFIGAMTVLEDMVWSALEKEI